MFDVWQFRCQKEFTESMLSQFGTIFEFVKVRLVMVMINIIKSLKWAMLIDFDRFFGCEVL